MTDKHLREIIGTIRNIHPQLVEQYDIDHIKHSIHLDTPGLPRNEAELIDRMGTACSMFCKKYLFERIGVRPDEEGEDWIKTESIKYAEAELEVTKRTMKNVGHEG